MGRDFPQGALAIVLVVSLSVSVPGPVAVAGPLKAGKTVTGAPRAPSDPPGAQPAVVSPGADKIVLLTRTTLLTFNDALQSGNFTVLRDRASPAFQKANTAARLSQVFSNLLAQHVDLSLVAMTVPQLSAAPTIDAQNRLRFAGFFPGQPQFNFELTFEPVEGQWRLLELSAGISAPFIAEIEQQRAPQSISK
jgi:hypothetical protein